MWPFNLRQKFSLGTGKCQSYVTSIWSIDVIEVELCTSLSCFGHFAFWVFAAMGLDIDCTPCCISHLAIAAESKRTQEPTRNDGMLPFFARLRIVSRETWSNSASSSAFKAR